MKYDDLKGVNAEIKTIGISRYDKEKKATVTTQYAEVKERVKAFRKLFPEGFITTSIIELTDTRVVMKAEAGFFDENHNPIVPIVLATGTAFEVKSGVVNSQSYIENCESSAVGRCLGMLGIGIDTAIASADEMQNRGAVAEEPAAEGNTPPQEEKKVVEDARQNVIDEAKVKVLMQALAKTGIPLDKVLRLYKVESLAVMKMYQWNHCMQNLEKIKDVEV